VTISRRENAVRAVGAPDAGGMIESNARLRVIRGGNLRGFDSLFESE
jgi:hypothetical protein